MRMASRADSIPHTASTHELVFASLTGLATVCPLMLFAYAALQATEAVGLWMVKRWGEYFAVVATSVFLPLEIHELLNRVTVLRVLALVVNIAAVVCTSGTTNAGRPMRTVADWP